MIDTLLEDVRTIQSVLLDSAQVVVWAIGRKGVTKIECYPENGEYGYVPFLAIYKDDILTERASALHYRIVYEDAYK